MAVESEVLATRLELIGLGEFSSLLSRAGRALGLYSEDLTKAQRHMLGIGLATATASVGILDFLFKAAEAAGEEAATFGRASAAFEAHGHSFPNKEIEEFTSRIQNLTGVEDEQIASMLGLLGAFGATGDQAEALTLPLLNTAEVLKATGMSADALARQIGMALESGKAGRLGRLIGLDEAAFAVDRFGAIMDALKKKGGNAAEEFAKTLPGAMARMKNSLKDVEEAIGSSLVGPLSTAATNIGTVAEAIAKVPGAGATIALVLGGAAAAMLYYSIQTAAAFRNTVLLAEAQLAQAKAATTQATANVTAGTRMGISGGALGKVGGFAILAELAGLGIGALTKGKGGAAEEFGGIAEGALQFGGAGAFAGSFFGPIGTAVGGAIGLIGGGIKGYFDAEAAKKEKTPEQRIQEEIAKNTAETAKNTADLAKASGNKDVDRILGLGRINRELAAKLGGRA